MPEEIQITVYKYEELEGEAQERARIKVGEWNAEWENECLKGEFEDKLEERGLPTKDIQWSLGYRQGDGVAFYGDIDVEKCLRFNRSYTKFRHVFRREIDVYAVILSNSWGTHYAHYNTMDVQCQQDEALQEWLQEYVRDVSHELEAYGYNAFDHAYADETVKETCDANDYRFDQWGNVV